MLVKLQPRAQVQSAQRTPFQRMCSQEKQDQHLPLLTGCCSHAGKVTDTERSTTDGFAKGVLRLAGLDQWCDQQADIQFQNENLLLRIDGKVVAIVPDLICCLDTHSK